MRLLTDTRELLGWLRKAAAHRSVPRQLLDLVHLRLRIQTHWRDYYFYRFYLGDKTLEEMSRFVSKRGSLYYPYGNNPVRYMGLFHHKALMKHVLQGSGIPVPRTVCVVGSSEGIGSYEEFARALSAEETDLIAKPTDGSGGRGLRVLMRSAGEWRSTTGEVGLAEIWRSLTEATDGTDARAHLIEPRLRNHRAIAALGAESLNTMRIVTLRTRDGAWVPIYRTLRIGRRGSWVDNLGAGGVQLYLDEEGRCFQAFDWSQKRPVSTHPDSGHPLVGFAIPRYAEAEQLVLRGAEHFPFMGILGWDVAITEDGIEIVEVNPYPDCHYAQQGTNRGWLTPEIAARLEPRRPLQRWDPHRVRPGFRYSRIRV